MGVYPTIVTLIFRFFFMTQFWNGANEKKGIIFAHFFIFLITLLESFLFLFGFEAAFSRCIAPEVSKSSGSTPIDKKGLLWSDIRRMPRPNDQLQREMDGSLGQSPEVHLNLDATCY